MSFMSLPPILHNHLHLMSKQSHFTEDTIVSTSPEVGTVQCYRPHLSRPFKDGYSSYLKHTCRVTMLDIMAKNVLVFKPKNMHVLWKSLNLSVN